MLQLPCDQNHSSKKRDYLSLNIISVWLLLINLYVHSGATKSGHQDVRWKKRRVSRRDILSYTIILCLLEKAGLEDNKKGDIYCSLEQPNHSSGRRAAWRKRVCRWTRHKNAFTSMSACKPADRHKSDLCQLYQKQQPMLMFLWHHRHWLFLMKRNECQTAESEGFCGPRIFLMLAQLW